MKNKLIISVAVLGLLLSGCSSAAQEKVTLGTVTEVKNETTTKSNIELKKENQKNTELFREIGEVTKVVGNEVTLKLIKVQAATDSDKSQDEASRDKKSSGQGKFPGGGQTGRKVKVEYTGEVATIIIPVGTPIYSRSMNGQEAVELEEITTGSKLTLMYNNNQKDKIISERTINQVTLIKGR
ncbi:MAG: hypothetical protein N4A76_00050 [Firmicutes bacterium]|jgi:hypothetical protein|nr:hypothetical protein [Bacillota bacterium]